MRDTSDVGCPSASLELRLGTRRDYEALAAFHYRAGPPATMVRVLAMIDPRERTSAGVLTISMPTLRGPWRSIAWAERYCAHARRRETPSMTRSRACRDVLSRLNDEVRCISRVIIDPRWRGLGVASRLVRHYLESPMTPRTEAVAAMGAASPFFERAGMTPVKIPPTPADDRLRDAADHVGVSAIEMLDPRRWARVEASARQWLAREIRRWAQQRPSLRTIDDLDVLARWAGQSLLASPMAYVASSDGVGEACA